MSARRYMLVTDIVSDFVRLPQGPVYERVVAVGGEALCVSIITAAELRYGCSKKGSPRLLAQVEAILSGLEILPFDVDADAQYGGIRAELRLPASRSAPMTY